MKRCVLVCLMMCAVLPCIHAQSDVVNLNLQRHQEWERRFYTHAQWVLWEGDTIPFFQYRPVFVYPPIKFKNNKERTDYLKLIRDVKKVQPLAGMIQSMLIETYEYMRDMTPSEQKKHINTIEKDLMRQYKPEFKKLTLSQGKLLIRLVDRQCASSSYDIIRAFAGKFQAGVYQTLAATFGASLRKEYDPKGKDKLTERIIILVMNEQL